MHDILARYNIILSWYYKCTYVISSHFNYRGNNSRIDKEYKKEDKILIVLKKVEQDSKLNYLTEGHYTIVKVYNNGAIKRTKRKISINRIKPYNDLRK